MLRGGPRGGKRAPVGSKALHCRGSIRATRTRLAGPRTRLALVASLALLASGCCCCEACEGCTGVLLPGGTQTVTTGEAYVRGLGDLRRVCPELRSLERDPFAFDLGTSAAGETMKLRYDLVCSSGKGTAEVWFRKDGTRWVAIGAAVVVAGAAASAGSRPEIQVESGGDWDWD